MSFSEIKNNWDMFGKRFCIVAANYNAKIVDNLLEGATATLLEHRVKENDCVIVRVPGAFEIPLTAKLCAETGQYTAIIALGCVIRGQTDHYDLVISECSRGITQVMLETHVPIAFGVLAVDEIDLAHARSQLASKHNRGREAALAAMEMANMKELIKPS